ncbi:MAG TPA: hypothetical protein VI461_02715 [Chitinophagaceae bacterium]|nr:hypothetical protein [Chitinophagaceae bacterium]
MFQKYDCIKKIVLVLSAILFSAAVNAQEEEDSARRLSTEIERLKDSVLQAPPEEEEVYDEDYQDTTPVPDRSVYFLDKRLQPNGGGPDSMRYRNLPDSVIKRIKADEKFWYVNYPFEKKEKPKEKKDDVPFVETELFQTLLWLVIIGSFIAVIILYLANSNIGLFRKASKTAAEGSEDYVETDNIFEINYQQEIDKAISNKNYRFATRLMFLRLLKSLSDKKIISYKQDRTNFDYLLQLHSTKYYDNFFRLTRFYEYSWYGQFDIDPEKFPAIKNDFDNFDRNLK